MTNRNVELMDPLGNALEADHGDVLREMLGTTLQAFMDMEVDDACGARARGTHRPPISPTPPALGWVTLPARFQEPTMTALSLRILLPTLLLTVACNGSKPDATDTDTGGAGAGPWEVLFDGLDGGVMLSAATVGDEVIIAGGDYGTSGSLWHYDGTTLCREDVADAALWWVHGRSEDDWYAVGEEALVVHHLEGAVVREDLPSKGLTLYGVYDDGSQVWAVGGYTRGDGSGEIWRKVDGGDWTLEATTPGLAFKTWENWFVGPGFVWFYDGTDFVDRTPEGAPRLLTVRGQSADDVWAVGGLISPELWHWSDGAWSQPTVEPTCLQGGLNGVWTAPGEPVWLAGNEGGMAFLEDDGTWVCPSAPLVNKGFHAVWRTGDEALWVGGNLASTKARKATIARYTLDGATPQPVTDEGLCSAE